MPATAFNHFQQDLARARALIDLAELLPATNPAERSLRSDVLRSAWMFAVGALDAYFCDAYTDIIAATIISKSRHPAAELPQFFNEIKFPVRAILEFYDTNANWRWRMAARAMMARENVLSLETVQRLFNRFFRTDRKFFRGLLDSWILHPSAKSRVVGITRADYLALASAAEKDRARGEAQSQMFDRFEMIFQRRHDCIHNCDRPRVAPQPLVKGGTVIKITEDVEFLVTRCNEHIDVEFREFLLRCNCPAAIVAQAGY